MTEELKRRRVATFGRPAVRLIRIAAATIAAAVVLLNGGARSSAQGGPPPDFSPAGLDPERSYFSAAPFEAIDMVNGDLNLTFTDLVLPGNAGFDLRFIRTYNHQTGLWRFGLAGIPWRIGRPAGDPNDFSEYPQLIMADGSVRKLNPRDGVFGSDVFLTDDYWRYTKSTRTLEMPNGWVATFETGNPSGGVMVAEVHDLYGNSIDFDWEGGAATDIRPLRLNGVFQMLGFSPTPTRTVEFQYDEMSSECGMIPRKMIYLGREWSYDCEFASPELQSGWRLTEAKPPVGPAWEYSYDDGNDGSVTVTTPQGGKVTYQFAEQILPPYEGIARSVISSRSTEGPDIVPGTWQFELSEPPGGQAFGTVTMPSGRKIEFQHGWKPFKQGWLLDRKTVRDANGAEVAKVQLGYTDLPGVAAALTSKDITQDGLTYTTTYEYRDSNFADYRQPWRVTENGQKQRVTERTFDYDFEASTYLLNRVATETVTVDGQSFASSYEYENINAFLEAETKAGVRTTFGRDAYGNRNRTTDANNHSTTVTFDFGVAKDTTTPEYEIHRSINPDGTVAWEETSDQNHRTHFDYDDLGRVELVSPPGVTPTETNYNEINGREIETKRGARVTTAYLDGFGRQIRTLDSAGVRTSTQYDAEGYVVYEGAPYSSTDRGDSLTYDALGRLKRRTHPGGSYVEYSYSGRTVSIRDEEDHTTTQVWDYFGAPSGGRLAKVTDADNKSWEYTYHPLGMLTGVTPPDGAPGRSWHYNAKTFLDSETHPESGTVTYTPDNVGNVLAKRDASQQDFTYSYDGLNRLKHIDAPGTAHDVEIRYEGPNRKEMWNGYVFSEFHYDATDRLRERTDQIAGQSFTTLYDYDGLDNLTRIEYPNHRKVRYDIDPGNGSRVTRVYEESGTTFADQIDYHASGAISEFRSGNGLTNHVGFDIRSRPEGLDAGPLHLTYGYDDAGNVRSITDTRPQFSQTFDYDSIDRLAHVYGSFGATDFTYYADGNRKTKGSVTYEYSPITNRLRHVTGGVEAADYGYDDNGNLDEAPGTTFTYTPFNMMETIAVTNAQTQVVSTTTYRYDADNMRALRLRANGASDYFVHGLSGELLAEYAGAGTGAQWVQDYIYLGSKLIASVAAPLPTVGFAPSTASAPENAGSVSATLVLAIPGGQPLTQPVSVRYATANGSAQAGQDFVATSGTVTFPIGSVSGATQPITVTLTDDTADEGNEHFTVTLSDPIGADVGAILDVTLLDNDPHVVVTLDAPLNGSSFVGYFAVGGWAINTRAPAGTGIDAVSVYARPVGGTATLLGAATYGGPRPDVGTAYGAQFTASGFDYLVAPLAAGDYDIYTSVHVTADGSWRDSAPVRITMEVTQAMALDIPQNNTQSGQAVTVAGWAIDRNSVSGTGVDLVRVRAFPPTGPPVELGNAPYGGDRSDIGTLFGERFRPSGFHLTTTALTAGTWQIVAAARSTSTGQFLQSRSATITIASDPGKSLDAPANGSTVGPSFGVGGWVIDRASASGTGITAVNIYVVNSAGVRTNLGAASLGGERPDIAALFGERFRYSGFNYITAGLASGTYALHAEARSVVTGTFSIDMQSSITVVGAPQVSFTAATATVAEGAASLAIPIRLLTATPITAAVSVYYATANGTAVSGAGADYTAISAPVTFQIGSPSGSTQTALIPINQDGVDEPNETFTVSLYSPMGGTLGSPSTITVTILDDDPVPDPHIALDAPANGQAGGATIGIGGWALDSHAPSGVGITTVNVYAYPNADFNQNPILLASVTPSVARSDVAAVYGSQFLNSGFNSVATLPAPGLYAVRARGWDPLLGNWTAWSAAANVTVQSTPLMSLDLPTGGTVLSNFSIAGWAVDRGASTGTGVDWIDVWAYPPMGQPPIYVGSATYGASRPDIGALYGSRFTPSGFSMTAHLSGGTYQLYVYARSTVTGTFNQVRNVSITVMGGAAPEANEEDESDRLFESQAEAPPPDRRPEQMALPASRFRSGGVQ